MKLFFKQIPTNKLKPIIQDNNHQLILADVGGACYTKQIGEKIPPLRRKR